MIAEHVGDAITELKAQPGGPMLTTGSATLVQSLLDDNLVDELQLLNPAASARTW